MAAIHAVAFYVDSKKMEPAQVSAVAEAGTLVTTLTVRLPPAAIDKVARYIVTCHALMRARAISGRAEAEDTRCISLAESN